MIFLLKLVLISITASFLVFGMDIRRRDNVRASTNSWAIIVMKLASISLLFIHVWSIFSIQVIGLPQVVCFILTLVGVSLIAWAKVSLGKNFSWTGYQVVNMEIVNHGPYRFMKHPLYYGVFIFEAGAVINFVSITWPAHPFALICPTIALIYAVLFNLSMAKKETLNIQRLQNKVS